MTEISGEEILKQNMAALEAGQELPFTEDMPEVKTDESSDELANLDDNAKEIVKKDGYVTKEEWVASGKDPDDYLTAEEFAKVGSIRDSDKSKNQIAKQLVQMERVMNDMIRGQQQMLDDAKAKERQKTLDELQARRKEAIDYKDVDELEKVTKEIIKVESEKPIVKEEVIVDSSVKNWYEANKHWYSVDSSAKTVIDIELSKQHAKGVPFEEAIVFAEAKAKKYFPFYFDEEPAKQESATTLDKFKPKGVTETATRKPPTSANKKTFADLDEGMRVVAKAAAKASGMTEAEYMAQIKL